MVRGEIDRHLGPSSGQFEVDSSEFPLITNVGTKINALCTYVFQELNNFYYKQYKCRQCNIVHDIARNVNLSYDDILAVCPPYC